MIITLPIYWEQLRKTKPNKTVLLSLNWYRNAHHYAQNAMKKDFHELVYKQLNQYNNTTINAFKNKFRLHLELYYKNTNCDGSNVVPLIEKVLLDALQEHNVITQDSIKYHVGSSWRVVRQDKENPRCVVTLINCTEE